MDSWNERISRSLDADMRKASLSLRFCEAHKEFMGKGSGYAQEVLSGYTLYERVKMNLSREVSGWNAETRNFDFVNSRKIRYRVARLYVRR
jgi:hypothetical protein